MKKLIQEHHTSITALEIFQASHFSSRASIEKDQISSMVVRIFDGKAEHHFRLDMFTVACLGKAIDMWSEAEERRDSIPKFGAKT